MCGILLVKSKNHIPLAMHLSAFKRLESRGPDFGQYQYFGDVFIGQTVLHITGTDQYYKTSHKNFLAYNGEIYNFREFGNYSNDIEFVHDAVENDIQLLEKGWGSWAFAWTDGNTVKYATDPQGERCLYQYQDDSILIVCSEVGPILDYVKVAKVPTEYTTRHWCMLDKTPYQNIIKITPGELYQDGESVATIDSIWSWITEPKYKNIDEAYEDFRATWQTVTKLITPTQPAALAYSGGLDSGIILSHIDNLELYSTNMLGKDPIVDCIKNFLTDKEQSRLHEFLIDEQQWAMAFKDILAKTHMPVQSWSFVGQWIINQHCKEKILFTGVGADELFGGYDVYQKLNFQVESSVSPYSSSTDTKTWTKCLDAYDQHAGQATLLMDYLYQVTGCDARGIDVIAGQWGIEGRNPFLAKPIMQLALNLPFDYKVGSVPKPLIRRLFLKRWQDTDIMPKKGFSGHCNDSLPWLGVDIAHSDNRDQEWREIVLKSFYTDPR